MMHGQKNIKWNNSSFQLCMQHKGKIAYLV